MRILPRHFPWLHHDQLPAIEISPLLLGASRQTGEQVLKQFDAQLEGLSDNEAEARLAQHGLNVVGQERHFGRLAILSRALLNPLVLLLSLLAALSCATGDVRAAVVMLVMVVLGVVLRYFQEVRADAAAAKLKAMIHVTATVVRNGAAREVPLAQLVPGDIVRLAAGDMIPADVRLLASKELFVIEASLTGESAPREKEECACTAAQVGPLELHNTCFLGTSVGSGAATAIVVTTGAKTYLGTMSSAMVETPPSSSFDKGVRDFTWLMIRFIAVMVPLVFLINVFTKHDWQQAFFFAMAVAVGLTPEMLPMIVTVCLSKGAIAMSRKKVIVKQLGAIQNLGAMDILCTDKTGTLTQDRVILRRHCNVALEEDDGVLLLAYLNSHFQTGLNNILDRSIMEHSVFAGHETINQYEKLDEIPFDFTRRVMSVVVKTPTGGTRLIAKGAPEAIFSRCTRFEIDGEPCPIEPMMLNDLTDEYEELSADGFRVLALAYRDLDRKSAYHHQDEAELVLKGYVAFLDPPKESAGPAIAALERQGVVVKILTGDNDLVTRKICGEVGLSVENILLGKDVDTLDDNALAAAALRTHVFARLAPAHKQRIIKALQSHGHVVGFLGDGINDAPALRTADVGISVDSAVDIAKESADVILLEKSLLTLEAGVIEGRRVFANILKYIRMGASSNFGNMFSVLGASVFLPYLPMAPIQILTNNLLYDFSQTPIPTDEVDPEQLAKPRPWSMKELARFIVCVGPISSIFDYTTFFMMLYVFGCWNTSPESQSLFHTGWFVESLLTQTLVIHIIRTHRIPFVQSRASWPLLAMTGLIALIGIWLPYSPLADTLGFVPLPLFYWPLLAATLFGYALLMQGMKLWLIRKGWM